jgi:hypothetical protein
MYPHVETMANFWKRDGGYKGSRCVAVLVLILVPSWI